MKRLLLLFWIVSAYAGTSHSQAKIPSPQDVFGFRMGEDRKLINWNQITDYFKKVDEQSERVQVQELGKTTLGKPFLMAIISSEGNLKNLKRYQEIQRRLANPQSLEAAEASRLIEEGKTVVLITLNIHSTEIASSQESVELLHELATASAPLTKKILNEVILLLIPSLNPDGQQIVTDWYRKTLGTPAEGSSPPELYHHYAGHDNNRDFFMFNLVESQHTARVLYRDWFPEIVYDQHQMGSNGPRLFLPPYEDPVSPHIAPALMAQVNLLGKFLVADLHRQGFKGVVTGTRFNAFFMGTMSKTPLWHNRIGILSEMASANIATPIFFPKGSLSGHGPNLLENKAQTNFLDPWQGGWWRLRDIIEYEKAVSYSLLDFAATLKERLKTVYYQLNREAIGKGRSEAPHAYAIPLDQHNPNAAAALANTLALGGVEIQQITKPVQVGTRTVPVGSFWISMAQACRAYIKDLMEAQRYPDMRRYQGGPPQPPYDVTAWTLPMQMGVDVIPLATPLNVEVKTIERAVIQASIEKGSEGHYAIERRFTNSFGLAHTLLKENISLSEALKGFVVGDSSFSAGSFLISKRDLLPSKLEPLAKEWQLPVKSIGLSVNIETRLLKRARIGIYQPWLTSMDEGWTRYVFDQFKVEYRLLHSEDFTKKTAALHEELDVLLLADMSPSMIVDGRSSRDEMLGTPARPKEYQSGIGTEGVEAIRDFVKNGGTLLCLAGSADFAIEHLRLPVVNVLKGVANSAFYAPGSIFEAQVNPHYSMAFGMKERAYLYYTNEPTFRLLPYNRETRTIADYGPGNPLRSGWLLGEGHLSERVAMVEVPVEKGRVVLYGFRVQHRAQTHGTYPLLLNATFVGKE